MSLTVAIQMDPIAGIDIAADSTFAMALEAQARGHRLFHYEVRHMAWEGGRLTARAHPMSVKPVKGDHFAFGPEETIDLGEVDTILMRQDPPFDMAYISATHLLERVADRVLVVNDPSAVRNAPEKLFATEFPEFMPPTLITRDIQAVKAFRERYEDVILKPLYGNGGSGVFHLKPGDSNLTSLMETFERLSNEPLMIQRYQPEIRQGDKRIILIEGEPVGAVNRMPGHGEARANFHAGGSAAKTDLTPRDKEICAAIGETLREQGLIFVGIDVIGGYLTEINVTSPTGIHEINRLNGVKLESEFWDAVERRLAKRRARAAG